MVLRNFPLATKLQVIERFICLEGLCYRNGELIIIDYQP